MTRLARRMALGALALAVAALAACGSPAPTAAPGSASAVKLYLSETGIYRVSRADLQAAGLDVPASALPNLRLTHYADEIPIEVTQNGDDFSVLFYAAPEANPYSASDVYWLRLGNTPGARIESSPIEPPQTGLAATTFPATLHLEEDALYFPNAVGDTHWYWRSLTAPASNAIPVTLPGYAGGEAQVRLALAGLTQGTHQVQVLVNGQPAGEAAWEGAAPYLFEATTSALQPGENGITLNLPGATGAAEVNLVDWAEVEYPRAFTAVDGALAFEGFGGNLRVGGFASEEVAVYEVTVPSAPKRLTGFTAAPEGEGVTVAFYDGLPNSYIALTPEAARRPAELRPAHAPARGLRAADPQADYLIVAPAEFFAALQPLVQHRTETGLSVQLVNIEDVYDAFSGGVPDPRGLRDFLAYAHTSWAAPAPRFVLLVGKASYDYHDNLGGENKNLVPTYLVNTPHLGQAASDNWFVAASEDDLTPTMALGRIPAKTPAQVKAAVDKIIAYEQAQTSGADWRTRAVFAADDKDPIFNQSTALLAGALAPSVAPQTILLSEHGGDVEATRSEIIRAWNDGALLMTYIGHGSIDTWAAGPLFSSQNLDEIHNGDKLPILFTPTCLDGYFYHPEADSLTEALLFKTDGGIVAGLAPTGLSLPTAQDMLMEALFEELFARPAPTLGEAILRGRAQMDDEGLSMREVLQTFVLLGDPALRWQPPG